MTTRKSLFGVLLLFASLPAFAAVARAQNTTAAPTADDVIEKHLAAMGGREALGKLTSRHSTGTVSISTPAGELGGTIETFAKPPNKTRVSMKLDLTAMGGGEMIVEQRFDGTSGSTFNSMQGETELSGNQLENMRNAAFPSPLLHYKDAGSKVELLPKDKLAGKDAIVLLLTPKSGSAVKLFLDPDTYLISRTVATVNAPQAGGNIEQTSDLSDYRTVDGVKVAFQVAQSSPVQSLTITFKTVEHNVAVDDATFGKK